MSATAVTWILFTYLTVASSQSLRQYSDTPLPNQGICRSKVCPTLSLFKAYYKNCIVVIGTLQVTILEQTTDEDFEMFSFPNLREVTEFLVVYRVKGLHSIGQLFPSLARIRGEKLLNNYGLIVHDINTLKEIGLYGLLKIDRGGVMIWGVPHACFIDTVDWRTIVPRSRLVISPQDRLAHCNFPCSCSLNTTVNRCWNNKKCQIYLEGTEADVCHEQCLGCRKTKSHVCTLCRYYTHNGTCVSKCPSNTIILPNSQYCITSEECDNLDGWVWNNTCVFHCPLDYVEENTASSTTCIYYPTFNKTCQNVAVWAVSKAQEAEGCVFINGSLEIYIRPVPEVMEELMTYLNRIEEVTDFVAIYSSSTITSLDFLPSLKRIQGRTLKNGKYSLMIHNMENLHKLFTPTVTKNLKIDRGTLKIYNNPVLCKSQIDLITPLFPVQPNHETDIPSGTNGYSGDCEDGVSFQVRIVNKTSAMIMFSTIPDPDAHYSVLYVRLPPGAHQNLVPETCSDSEWYVINVDTSFGHQFGVVELKSLQPASTYAVCIETYDPGHKILTRSAISNFTTPVGKPEPPFIRELVALDSTTAEIHWVDHRDYKPFITHHQLDVSLLEIYEKDIAARDQCSNSEYTDYTEYSDLNRHTIVMRPPPEYPLSCESTCGVSIITEATIEKKLDVCTSISCDNQEEEIIGNSFFKKYVRTLVLNLKSLKSDSFRVEGLAPYRDYRFRLRACTENECSRSAREVVRTKTSEAADVPANVHIEANEDGHISLKWDPPEITNGPILSFSIEVVPIINHESTIRLPPQTWCVLANTTSYSVKTVITKTYSVRVCTRSMAFDVACAEWKSLEVVTAPSSSTWWWTAVIFAVGLYIASLVGGSIVKKRTTSIDMEPILELTVSLDESVPPSKMFSDFAPMYEVPLRDTRLE